jgi:hypothetical protein
MSRYPKIECTQELMDEVCALIATNPCSLVKICKDNPRLPAPNLLFKMMLAHPEFELAYARAKEKQIETLLDDAQNAVEEIEQYTYIDKQGNKRIDWGAASVARLKLDNTKWFAARLLPKRYAEKKEETETAVKQPINIYYDKKPQ